MGPMEGRIAQPVRVSYQARLRGGPDDGAVVNVTALPGGGPPDFFHAGPDDQGLYMLAGAQNADRTMPYWWIPDHCRLPTSVGPEGATWTLISMAPDGRTAKVWHQHGAGATPMRLSMESLESARVPSFVGRGYVCNECDALTVISLPKVEDDPEAE